MTTGAPGRHRTRPGSTALLKALRARRVTTVFIEESRTLVTVQLEVSADTLSILAENVVLLQQIPYQDRLMRVLSVLKMRFSAHDVTLREFRIAPPTGLRVLAPVETGAETLVGIARQQGAPTMASTHALAEDTRPEAR